MFNNREISRRTFLIMGLTGLVGTVGLTNDSPRQEKNLQPVVVSTAEAVESIFKDNELFKAMPTFQGWMPDGSMKTGLFGMSMFDKDWARQNTFLQVADGQKINFSEYDKFPAAQLVRADGGDALTFFKKLRKSWEQVRKPVEITERQWLDMLKNASPAAQQRWLEMGVVPELDLPVATGRQFDWDKEALNDPVTREALSSPKEEHRKVYWLAKGKTDTAWPLDQGRYAESWSSIRKSDRNYENWDKVAVTTITFGESLKVGLEGSLPFVSPHPWPGGYKPLGHWVEL